ncbi:hypothetical protein B14911_10687 [Bacillus sp. NRRL B-14911]|uniref:hypothetical protein n=1 Tax=Bacillus sp. NRRL B-14911 TaxID=313627 RepID=UPI00006B595F|nr:hypothetical protein [Bacillus sp. NRRL B-14911]EAR66195.1 hypothetical protein B14911_10687 [Bacillus sp. NRRL B-14911]
MEKKPNKVQEKYINISEISPQFLDAMKEITRAVTQVAEELSKAIAHINIREFELPKFNFPEIDYKKIRSIIEHNSRSGWTLSGEMGLGDYINEELLSLSQEEVDSYFLAYYKYKNEELKINNYDETKTVILESINSKWDDIIQSCFNCYEIGMYKMAIPNLLMIIEGEISEIADSGLVGGKLLTHWKKDIDTESDKFDAIGLFSVYVFLREVLFKTREFHKKRLKVINRNWVLHGRDDPIYWKEEDYFRLINTLSSMQFVKEIVRKQ